MSISQQDLDVTHAISAATDYAIPFAYWSEADLAVWHVPAAAARRLLRVGLDYDLIQPGLSHFGGRLRLRTPLVGGRLLIRRETRIIQGFSAPQTARGFEHALDRLAMVLQEANRNLGETDARLQQQIRALASEIRAEHSADMISLRREHAADVAALRAEMIALFGRSLRTPEPIPELPAARARVSRALTFDAAGRPRMVDFYAVNPFLPICEAPRWTPAARACAAPVWTPDAEICPPRNVMIGGCA